MLTPKLLVDAGVCHREDLVVFNDFIFPLKLGQILHVHEATDLAFIHNVEQLNADAHGFLYLNRVRVRVVNLEGELSLLAELCKGIRVTSVNLLLPLLLHVYDVEEADAVFGHLELVLAFLQLRI